MAETVGQAQTVQVPNYSGVNIQIFNPSVAAPGAVVPPANINTTNYSTAQTYPPNYYTQNFAQPVTQPPAVQPVAPATQAQEAEKKKTEKRQIVKLTDDYIKTLENYLNNPSQEVRLMGAKEVISRLEEDDTRKNDPALNALVNKMLQDPYQPIKFMAMAALDTRIANGNNTSVGLLKNIQKQKTNYGQDSLQASNILLKMSGTTTEKEFEVKDTQKEKTKEK